MSRETIADKEQIIDLPLLEQADRLAGEIGHTPMHEVKNLTKNRNVRIFAKKEWRQLSGSVKARAAFRIIRQAIQTGQLTRKKTLLDATSGNTGIAYAAIGQKLGLNITLCLPENASQKRKDILESLGARIVYTSRFEGTDGAQEVARNLAESQPDHFFYADQYSNKANWQAHYLGTAREIIREVPDITHFVAGLGTTGTFTGTSRRLKEYNPDIERIALQPDSPMHGLEGWKHLETARVPFIYDPELATSIREINASDVYDFILKAYDYEGLWLSPSSAANLLGTLQIAETLEYGNLVTILPDNADKYSEITNQLLNKEL